MGECQTGKTSMTQQLTTDGTHFPKNYLLTTCADVSVKSINIPDTNDCVELYLLDCSGREMYGDMLRSKIWKNVSLVLAMYDVTREDTFGAAAKVVDNRKPSAVVGNDQPVFRVAIFIMS